MLFLHCSVQYMYYIDSVVNIQWHFFDNFVKKNNMFLEIKGRDQTCTSLCLLIFCIV